MLFQQHVIRMCSHCFFPACWQVVNGLLTTCYRVVELNRLVTSCSNNLLSSCISTTCQITWALFQLIDKLNCYKPVANTSCWQVVRFLRVYRLHTFRVHGFMSWGRLFKARIGSNPGLKYNLPAVYFVYFCTSVVSKLQKRKLSLVYTIFLKKYFQIYWTSCWEVCFELYRLT
jgi:hypothetical protein